MANPRQKRKLRSSASKAIQKPKKPNAHAKILGNALIAANWDHKQTLTQNYRRLGLAHRLRRPAGGTEDKIKVGAQFGDARVKGGQSVEGTREVRIRRDNGSGKVVLEEEEEGDHVTNKKEMGEKRKQRDEETAWGTLNDPINSASSSDNGDQADSETEGLNDHASTGHLGSKWSTPASFTTPTLSLPRNNNNNNNNNNNSNEAQHIHASLATSALTASTNRKLHKPTRTPSVRERAWIEALVAKHGDDFVAMSRDAKLNLRQQTVGDIKRRVRHFLATFEGK